ncbi:UNVERIFIED_CONTAM: hypothetical protein PYX00_005821 [Menopon gallinae]|uniref:Transmembrane protein 131 n=1 Tax=Menopon gallinae TaxID=328185 RepID=A0AAW2HT56_9NEOP
MAGYRIEKMKLRKLNYEFGGCYVFIITFFEILGKTHMSVHDNNHAFIQANSNDVRFMGVHDGLQVFMHNDITSSGVRISNMHDDLDKDDAFSTSTYLKFVPPQLDFKERYLGVPHLEKVMLVNTDNNKTIHMSSVSGNTLHFHSSFFQDKTIPPKGNTTFAVVFLGRAEGQVTSSLYIHTSEGTFKYQVSGSSIGSPYRLRPLGGVRLPLNAVFQRLIYLHNPHHYPIQVVEVYSSGSEFHLELPGGETESPKALWEVPPYTTKPVIRAKFQASVQSNHTAYIRLKLNNSEEVLVVPLEVEVTSQPGLYSTQHYIDFGIGGSEEQPKKIKLYLCNSLKKALRIQSIIVVPPSAALKVDFEPVKIPPGTSPVEVAELTFDWKLGFQTNQTSGKILIKSKQSQSKLVIPFSATILEGCLKINETSTRFLTTDSKPSPRNFTVVNEFKIPIAVNNVSLLEKASKYFEIKKFKPLIIYPRKSADLFTIAEKETNTRDIKLESSLILYTNISDITVPVLSYNGKLTKIFPQGFEDLELLDLGLVSSGSVKKIRFGLQNRNPVKVELLSVSSNSASVSPQLLGVFYGNVSAFLNEYSFADLVNCTYIKPNAIAVIELSIHASKNEEIMSAHVSVVGQYETLTIPVRVSVAHGSLEMIPRQIVLDDCFPGRICTQVLKVQSTFNRPMTVTAITSVPPDPRLGFSEPPGGSEILPSTSNYLGELRWDPRRSCGNQCYLGISSNFTNGLRWSDSEPLHPYICDTEATLLQDRYQRLLNVTNGVGSGHWQDVMLRLDTNEVREEMFHAKIRMIWPRFAKTSKLEFPLTQVTNTTVQRLKLYNPASHMIVVQLVMEWAYPQPKRLLDSLPQSFKPDSASHCFISSSKEFYISEGFGKSTEHRGIFNTTLAPGESYEVTIAYTPRAPQKSCTMLFIRNNLTVVEVVELTGQAAHAQLKFGNRKPGSNSPLMFEISEKHLRDCQREKARKFPTPNLTVKRSFIARNVGELPIFVHNFFINGLECEGYGFSVLNCGPFELPANGTRKIDVAFTPDFTLSKVQRTLNIQTSLGMEVNYTLIMTLPPIFLSACSAVLSRPTWEPLLYYSAVSFMAFLLFCVLAAAFFESDRILKCALMSLTRDRTAAPLDLRQIGTSVLKEFSMQTPYKKLESDHGEKGKQKDQNESSWGSGDDRHFMQKEEKYESDNRMEEPAEFPKEKDSSNAVQLNNLTKSKKKVGKKNVNNADGSVDAVHEPPSGKKKDKNVSNAGWCNLFSRGTTNAQDNKIKLKLSTTDNDNIHQIRNDIEPKKDDVKKDDKKNKLKKNNNKEPSKEEEETSSTMTDSSNDAEKENSDSLSRVKTDKTKKVTNKKVKTNVLECKDNYEGDCDDDEFEKEKKAGKTNNTWKVNTKPNRLNPLPDTIWKSNTTENNSQKALDFVKQRVNKNNLRERKEKNANKRHFGEKTGNQKVIEHTTVHYTTPCWEHRSFSEVVACNDGPALYSNIVSSKNHQAKQPLQQTSMYSEAVKSSEATASTTLGPIGSKKPISNWPQYSNNCNYQANLFNLNFAGAPTGFIGGNQTGSDFRGDGNSGMEDFLPMDPQNLWEDQHAVMQLMHQQENNQLSWKENWPDYLWCTNRGMQLSSNGTQAQDDYSDPSWNSLLNNAWSPTPWSPSTNQNQRTSLENNMNHFGNYNSDSEGLIGQTMLGSNLSLGQSNAILNQGLFPQASPRRAQADTAQNDENSQTNDSLVQNSLQFDPFHSFSSIWSPKAQNTWTSPGNQ